MSKTALVDVDDLCSEGQIREYLLPLKEKVHDLIVTAYAIPQHLGPVWDLAKEYPWIRFAQHGFEHTFCECLAWTESQAAYFLGLTRKMGYLPLFKPPNWEFDEELEKACIACGVTLHHHKEAVPSQKGLRHYPGKNRHHAYVHTHITRNPVTDFIEGHPEFTPEFLRDFSEFTTPLAEAKEF